MTEQLVAPTFLFRMAVPCLQSKKVWSASGIRLDETFRLPCFGELEGKNSFADVRGTWSPEGLTFQLEIAGKKQSAWCRASRLDESDGLRLWIDTRDMKSVHRATRFCHQFVVCPFGGGKGLDQPLAESIPINRARELPKPVPPTLLKLRSEQRIDGYLLQLHLPAAALTGFDADEHPKLGFMYAVFDRELGQQTMTISSDFRFQENPSLWGTLDLVSEP